MHEDLSLFASFLPSVCMNGPQLYISRDSPHGELHVPLGTWNVPVSGEFRNRAMPRWHSASILNLSLPPVPLEKLQGRTDRSSARVPGERSSWPAHLDPFSLPCPRSPCRNGSEVTSDFGGAPRGRARWSCGRVKHVASLSLSPCIQRGRARLTSSDPVVVTAIRRGAGGLVPHAVLVSSCPR